MTELIPYDIYENIFKRLNVRNLVRCKSVCKSWKSLISESRFVKVHLNRSYNSNENGHKRIGEAVFLESSDSGYSVIGSSYGLVCFTDGYELLVANPLTREVKPVPNPSHHVNPFPDPRAHYNDDDSCWGFGYDSLRDDYKVVCGVPEGKGQTDFQVYSLKSNAWKVIGKVNYTRNVHQYEAGVLCNGAIHWVMNPKNQYTKDVILSFDLSKEKFEEIPQPHYYYVRYSIDNDPNPYIHLGIMEECLCISFFIDNNTKCVVKKDNLKQSWVMVDNCQIMEEFGDDFWEVTDDPYSWNNYMWFIGDRKFAGGPVVVESLVSPHLQAENE